ncbi:MAG: hypothetical protein R3E60_05390 [Alphaproteobacteria bacterium]
MTLIEDIIEDRSHSMGSAGLSAKHQIFHPVTTLPVLPGWHPQVSLDTGLRALLNDISQPGKAR